MKKIRHIKIFTSFLTTWIVFSLFLTTCSIDNKAPSCTIISPPDKTAFKIGEEIIISVETKDDDGRVIAINLYVNGVMQSFIESDFLTFPYSFQWNSINESPGVYTFRVRVEDDQEAIGEDEISIFLIN